MQISISAKIGENVKLGENVHIGEYCIIEDHVVLGDNVFIDSNTIVRRNVSIGKGSFVGSNCILGEYLLDFCMDRKIHEHVLSIGDDALIRSGTVIYSRSEIGCAFQTGHRVTIREDSQIGDHVSIGTLSDVQGSCEIGSYVRIHSNVFVAPLTKIDSFAWIFPHAVLTNDPTPPSIHFSGVHVCCFAVVAAGAIIMPGIKIGQDALVAAGAVVTKEVEPYTAVAGNPAKRIKDVRMVKNRFTGEDVYPWRNEFKRYMPWVDSDFKTWYDNLSLEQQEKYGLDKVEIDSAI